MPDNLISLLKLNFKTNIKEHTKHVPYSVKYNDKSIPDRLLKNNINLPNNCIFFSDLVPFSKKDYSKSYGTFLKSLVSIAEFSRIFREKMNKEYKNKKVNKKKALEDKVYESNLLLLIKLIFKAGKPFYLVPGENPYTVVKCKEVIKPKYVGKIITWKGNRYRLYEYNIFLKLSDKTPGEFTKEDLNKSTCEDTKYTLDAISYKLLSQHSPTDALKDYYDKKYNKHLNDGEPIIEKKSLPKLYSKRGGTKKNKTKKQYTKKKKTRKRDIYKLDMYKMYY
jgi:hypothetical protein